MDKWTNGQSGGSTWYSEATVGSIDLLGKEPQPFSREAKVGKKCESEKTAREPT